MYTVYICIYTVCSTHILQFCMSSIVIQDEAVSPLTPDNTVLNVNFVFHLHEFNLHMFSMIVALA
jgi:hypothetical protein